MNLIFNQDSRGLVHLRIVFFRNENNVDANVRILRMQSRIRIKNLFCLPNVTNVYHNAFHAYHVCQFKFPQFRKIINLSILDFNWWISLPDLHRFANVQANPLQIKFHFIQMLSKYKPVFYRTYTSNQWHFGCNRCSLPIRPWNKMYSCLVNLCRFIAIRNEQTVCYARAISDNATFVSRW